MVPTDLLGAGVVLVGAAVGYFVREYQNRVRPFCQVSNLRGDLFKQTDTRDDIPDEIISKLKKAIYIETLNKTSTLGEMYRSWDATDDFIQLWPTTRKQLDIVLQCDTENELNQELPKLLQLSFFERVMLMMLGGDRLSFPKLPKKQPDKIPIYLSDENKGSAWVAFPNNTCNFGKLLNHPAVKAKVMPFLKTISLLHKPTLKKILSQARDICEQHYNLSNEISQTILDMMHDCSRWYFMVYFANLSNKPLMISTDCELTVKDKVSGTLKEACYVARFKGKDEESKLEDARTPLVVRGGQDISFVAISQKQQKDMKLGSVLREAYKRGQARCRIRFRVLKVGLINRQKVKTSWAPFVEGEAIISNIST